MSITNALGGVTSFEYDANDNITKVTDAEGNATTYEYDAVGNIITSTNAKGVNTLYTYDANYNVISVIDAAGVTAYTYDALNRVTGITDRNGNTQWFGYDAIGRITRVRDKNGNLTQYTYDGNGNIVATTDALGTVARFEYNANNKLVKVDLNRVDTIAGTDTHEVTLYEYDGRNLVTKEINALGDGTVYTYDGVGNLVSKADADGYVTEYTYNELDLVSNINYNSGKQATFAYNKVGQLVRMDDWTGINTFELDLLGQIKKATDHKGNVVEYTYNKVGNETSITYPNGEQVLNTYDEVYNLTQVQDPEKGLYNYTYDDSNRPTKLTYPNGWVETTTYDAEGNTLTVTDVDPFQLYNKTPKLKFEYRYDAEGNVVYEFQRDSDAEENRKTYTTYTYDALNRLTSSTRKLDIYPFNVDDRTYTYDSLGNLIQETKPENKKTTTKTYTYNDLNQMVGMKDCGYIQSITRINDFRYTYDKRGNLVKEEEVCSPTTQGPKDITIAEYTYDETNRMVMGTNKDGEASLYTFNALGVRVGTELILQDNTHGYTDFHCQTPSVDVPATGPHGPEVVKSDYVIDYNRLDVDQRVLMKHEEGGYNFRYVYGLDKLQVKTTGEGSDWWGQKVKKCVNMNYVHTDRLGSVMNLTDEYGRVTARTDYSDWGEVKAYTDIRVDGGFRVLLPEITYAGHEYDDVLNQFYAKARMYDAELKQFDSVDPVKGNITNPMSMVQYLYVLDNPLRYVDPMGLVPYKVLNLIGHGLALGYIPNEIAFTGIMLGGILNPWLAGHQLAQAFAYKWLYQDHGYRLITLEMAIPTDRRRVDVVAQRGSEITLFEIKHRTAPRFEEYERAQNVLEAANNQLAEYYTLLGCHLLDGYSFIFSTLSGETKYKLFGINNVSYYIHLRHRPTGVIEYWFSEHRENKRKQKVTVTELFPAQMEERYTQYRIIKAQYAQTIALMEGVTAVTVTVGVAVAGTMVGISIAAVAPEVAAWMAHAATNITITASAVASEVGAQIGSAVHHVGEILYQAGQSVLNPTSVAPSVVGLAFG